MRKLLYLAVILSLGAETPAMAQPIYLKCKIDYFSRVPETDTLFPGLKSINYVLFFKVDSTYNFISSVNRYEDGTFDSPYFNISDCESLPVPTRKWSGGCWFVPESFGYNWYVTENNNGRTGN